jgi:hypothetical protein
VSTRLAEEDAVLVWPAEWVVRFHPFRKVRGTEGARSCGHLRDKSTGGQICRAKESL